MAFPTSVNDQVTDVVELSEGLGPVVAKAIIDERYLGKVSNLCGTYVSLLANWVENGAVPVH